MYPGLPPGLAHNPFEIGHLFRDRSLWENPVYWDKIEGDTSVIVTYHRVEDALLASRRLHTDSYDVDVAAVRTLMIAVRPDASLESILEAAAYEAAKWWLVALVRDVSPLFTMHPTDALLVMRLLVWAEGSNESVEFALRSTKRHVDELDKAISIKDRGEISQTTRSTEENLQLAISEFARKRVEIREVGNVTINALFTWLSLLPRGHEATQLLLVQTEDGADRHTIDLIRWSAHYSAVRIKAFVPFEPTLVFGNVRCVRLEWNSGDLETMVNSAVRRAHKGAPFNGIKGIDDIELDMSDFLGDRTLLGWLADRGNGSIAQLMNFCDAILDGYRQRVQQSESLGPVSLDDVTTALNRLGLHNGSC